jgi:micrococcal nuclease
MQVGVQHIESLMVEIDLYTYRVNSYRVVDGDTLEITLDLGFNTFRKEKVRLARINAPEMKTEAGPASKSHLSELLADKILTVQTKKDEKDRYGRYIAEVWVQEKLADNASKITNINDKMLSDKMAVIYKD